VNNAFEMAVLNPQKHLAKEYFKFFLLYLIVLNVRKQGTKTPLHDIKCKVIRDEGLMK